MGLALAGPFGYIEHLSLRFLGIWLPSVAHSSVLRIPISGLHPLPLPCPVILTGSLCPHFHTSSLCPAPIYLSSSYLLFISLTINMSFTRAGRETEL